MPDDEESVTPTSCKKCGPWYLSDFKENEVFACVVCGKAKSSLTSEGDLVDFVTGMPYPWKEKEYTDWDKTIRELKKVRVEGIDSHRKWLKMVDNLIEYSKKGKAKDEEDSK